MGFTITHSQVAGTGADADAIVDGADWDANHTITGSVAASEVTSGAALTRVDDTNVTLTLGGTPTAALLAATSVTVGWSGTLAIARGGTGAATASAAFDALAPTTTRGDLIFRNATTNARLAAGTSGYALIAAGAGADPAWTGFLQSGTGAVTRTWQDKAKDFRTVKDYGATGDGTTDDYAALVLARDAAIAAGTAMIWTSGTYCISQTLELGYEKLEMIPLGKVTIKHTGTGVAVSFNGIANYPGTQGAAGILFGGPNRFFIEGNASTTNLVLIDNIHFSDIRFAGKNATNAILLLQDNGAVALASAVETLFDVLITPNSSGTFSTTPLYGIHATRAAACIFERPIIETVGSSSTAGIHLIDCVGNEFNGGTIESCNGGGIYLNSGCSRNTFVGVHNEFNGALHDWNIAGDHNTFIGCAGAGTTSGQTISGDRNLFIGGKWQSATVTAAGNGNRFENCQFVTAFTDSGVNTTVVNPDSLATAALKLPASDIFLDANQALRVGTSTDNVVSGDGSSFVRFGTTAARAARILAGSSEWKLFESGGMSNTGTDRGAGTLDLTGALYNNGTAPTGTGAYVRAISPTIASGTLADGASALIVTATQPASPTAEPQNAVAWTITSAGSASYQNNGFQISYAAGYTGSSATVALTLSNAAAGTGAYAVPAAGSNGYSGNVGARASATATTTGSNMGANFAAGNGNRNIGVIGTAQVAKNSAVNIGVLGSAINTGTSPVHVGGHFSLNQTTFPSVSAALIADNGSQTDPIARFKDNGTDVFKINDGGSALAYAATGGIGYGTGAGGAVTQITSKSTGVTLDKVCGQITTHNQSFSGNVTFTFTNSTIAATDVVLMLIQSGGTANSYLPPMVENITAGSCTVTLRNYSGGALAETLVLNYVVIKGVAA